MRLFHARAVIYLAVSFATPATAHAQTLVGRVIDDLTEAPISTVALMLLDSTEVAVAWAESDSVGRFFLTPPHPGTYHLYVDRLAYGEIVSERFFLPQRGSVELLVRMVPIPVEIDALVVSTERRRVKLEDQGFYRRRDRSMGYFFQPEDIAKWGPLRVTDALRRVPGVHLRRSRLGGLVALTQRFGRYCPMKVVVDGSALDVGDGSLDSWVNPANVIGMEIYPSGVGAPVQHRGLGSRCGIILIWTR